MLCVNRSSILLAARSLVFGFQGSERHCPGPARRGADGLEWATAASCLEVHVRLIGAGTHNARACEKDMSEDSEDSA